MSERVQPGRTLFQFVRFWARRWTGAGSGIEAERGRDVMVTEAVAALADGGGASVNDVARELGIDQSGASRMVAQAVARGYLVKSRAADARRRAVQVTEAGRELIDAAHAWQEQVFAELTADWSPEEVDRFTESMRRLVANSRAGG
ncbi:MarR family transcriptional regulator [Streptomyces daqingensis]|uniref:MarR family transcriptional regulator n=1 Tax=Streptomyces daqingensis TaxID=1472640 RepID=A0ABQ2LZ47_9ACTN|nr:MarR family winged helix-turn-helix transcriptional regulator [Streptomyces daqingensis]GGO44792.1 MarR family transcriptional regulator [Streptomyces daqingensis]